MSRFMLACLLSCAVALPAAAALKAGDAAPEFTAPASFAGKATDYSLKNALKKGPVVVFFHRSAYSRGCKVAATVGGMSPEANVEKALEAVRGLR